MNIHNNRVGCTFQCALPARKTGATPTSGTRAEKDLQTCFLEPVPDFVAQTEVIGNDQDC